MIRLPSPLLRFSHAMLSSIPITTSEKLSCSATVCKICRFFDCKVWCPKRLFCCCTNYRNGREVISAMSDQMKPRFLHRLLHATLFWSMKVCQNSFNPTNTQNQHKPEKKSIHSNLPYGGNCCCC